METFSALVAFGAGNSPATGEFPSQRPGTRSFVVFFNLGTNGWMDDRDAGNFRRHRVHYDVAVMFAVRQLVQEVLTNIVYVQYNHIRYCYKRNKQASCLSKVEEKVMSTVALHLREYWDFTCGKGFQLRGEFDGRWDHIDWLMQKHNSIANTLDLRLSCTNLSICFNWCKGVCILMCPMWVFLSHKVCQELVGSPGW